MKTPLVVGNWKMHGVQRDAAQLARRVRKGVRRLKGAEVVLAPPFTALPAVGKIIGGSRLHLAGQNVHWEEQGAFTGEISPGMLKDLGCRFVIIGHSERRRLFHESDRTVGKKLLAALNEGLRPILCIGETWEERKAAKTRRVVSRQLRIALKGVGKSAIGKLAIAYEPVWAIGTGRNATPEQASQVHLWIRRILSGLLGKDGAHKTRILYGGSVRPENAGELARAPQVDGLLVGGASLRADSFLNIVRFFIPDQCSL